MSAQWQSEFTLNCGLRLGGCGLPDMEKNIAVKMPVLPPRTSATAPWLRNVATSFDPFGATLVAVMSTSDFMKQFSMFATLAAASGGSAPSR
jgi:hypothetical protein